MTTTDTHTISVTKRNGETKTVQSPYDDAGARFRLREIREILGTRASDFMVSLNRQISSGHSRCLSPRQMAWVHILCVEWNARLAEEANPSASLIALPQIRSMMDLAAESIRFPKITLRTEASEMIKLSRTGRASRVPGTINVTNGRKWSDRRSVKYGTIDLDGNFRRWGSYQRGGIALEQCQLVIATLEAFNADPAAHATAYGHNTGSCCYCSRRLTDGRSVAVGYGPICADRFGLPWGDERASSTVEVTAEQVAPRHEDDLAEVMGYEGQEVQA